MACKYGRLSLVARKEERRAYAQTTKKVALPGWISQPRSQISLVLIHLSLVSSISLSAITLLLTRVNVPCFFSRICVISLIGSSSNGNGDSNENGKKEIGFFSKRAPLHVHHACLYLSLPYLHDYDVKVLNFTFCGGREQTTATFFFIS